MTENYKAGDRIRIERVIDGDVVGMLVGTLKQSKVEPNQLRFMLNNGFESIIKKRWFSAWLEDGWTVAEVLSRPLPTEPGLYVAHDEAADMANAGVLRLTEGGWQHVGFVTDATEAAEYLHKNLGGLVPLVAKTEKER